MISKDGKGMQDAYIIPFGMSNRYAFLMSFGYGCLALL